MNEYHSLFDFLFNVHFTNISLSVTFVSYTSENGEMFMDTRLLITQENQRHPVVSSWSK